MKRQSQFERKTRQLVDRMDRMAKRTMRKIGLGNRSIAGEQGNILVELALILPTFMMLLTGMFAFAFAYYNDLTLTQAVGSGAQYVQANAPNTADPCADAYSRITAAAPSLVAANISVSVSVNGGTAQTGSSCPQSLATTHGVPVTVSATYPCNINVFKFAVSSSCKLQAQATEFLY